MTEFAKKITADLDSVITRFKPVPTPCQRLELFWIAGMASPVSPGLTDIPSQELVEFENGVTRYRL